VILGAKIALSSLAVLRRAFVNVSTSSVAAYERDSTNVFIIAEKIYRVVAAVHDVEDAWRKATFVRKLSQLHRAEGNSL